VSGEHRSIDFSFQLVDIGMVKGGACFLFFIICGATMATAAVEADFFPSEVHGWALDPKADVYTPEDLYTYIDGASELYISYGFKKLFARRYTKPGWPEITVDLFVMSDAGSAFGIFAHSQENPGREVGRDSEYLDGLLRFWQGNYYVSLLCSPETPETRTALMALGRRMALRLPQPGERPAALRLLPEEGLIGASIRYFRHPAWQNTYVFLSADNILGIGPDTQALLARYDQGEQRPVVMVVAYPDRAAAERAFAGFSRIGKLPERGGAVPLADKKYLAALVEGNVVAAVWHGGGAAPCGQLLAAVREKIAAFENRPMTGRNP
jgi:hypothetical protein